MNTEACQNLLETSSDLFGLTMAQPGIAAGKFGSSGKMTIKPYSVREEHRHALLTVMVNQIEISSCGCWFWNGRTHNGYPCCSTPQGSTQWAHRVSYALFNGPIAAQRHIDHECRNPTCVNPAHLKQVTPLENYEAIQRRKIRSIKRMREQAGQVTIFDFIKESE